ncbi:UNVERIFIED_CONTAM: hypothetical protein K2H54_034452 [Gekko kuhli]
MPDQLSDVAARLAATMHPDLDDRSLNQSARGSAGNLSAEGPLLASAEDSLGRKGLVAVAVCLGTILLLGCLNNLLVVLIFARFRAIRTPINLILLNISLSDLLLCVFGTPLSFAASVRGRWLLGRAACQWYGFANAFLGRLSFIQGSRQAETDHT